MSPQNPGDGELGRGVCSHSAVQVTFPFAYLLLLMQHTIPPEPHLVM